MEEHFISPSEIQPTPVRPTRFDRFLISLFRVLRFLYSQMCLAVAWILEDHLRTKVGRLKINPNAKCPGCGHNDGEIKWMAHFPLVGGAVGAIVHHCKVCDANWPEKPIVDSAGWAIRLQEPEE